MVPRPLAAVTDHVADGVRGVDDHVEDHLVEVARHDRHGGQVGIEVGLQFGDVLPFVGRHGSRAGDGAVDVERRALGGRMREVLHGADDLADPVDAVDGLVDGGGDLGEQVVGIGFLQGLAEIGGEYPAVGGGVMPVA
jgi:hypothetical protein